MSGAYFALVPLLMLYPVELSAKGDNVEISIKGGSLPAPVVITDKQVLSRFLIWTGPGTGPNPPAPKSFIVDWANGIVGAPEKGLRLYEVEFLTTREGKNTYRVSYAYDPVKQQGYVFLPGKDDPRHEENVWLIYRDGIEGNWFRAWGEWTTS
jgi:hypothetical protein